MINIKDIKKQALDAYKFDIKRNAGVEFIAFIVKFALLFTLATLYIICLAKAGSVSVSFPILLIFIVTYILIYLFVIAPINLGRNYYFARVAAKTQPQTDELFHFYKNIKHAIWAYFRIAIAVIFYTVFFVAIIIVYFRVYSMLSSNWFSFLNFLVCAVIIALYALSIVVTRLKYSLLPAVYLKFSSSNPLPFVAKTLRYSRGVKSELFMLYLSFAGWYALGILSLGIGFIWINPYIRIASKIYLNEHIK